MSIQENIEARSRAECVMSLVEGECPRFFEELARLATGQLPPKPVPVDPFGPMDELEAIRFERRQMEFGKHEGEQMGTLPIGYIGWLAENDFARDLHRYVKSRRFKERQEQEL